MDAYQTMIKLLRELENYAQKTHALNALIDGTKRKRGKLPVSARALLTKYLFDEIEALPTAIENAKGYYEESAVFYFLDQLLGLTMLLFSSPFDIPEEIRLKLDSLVSRMKRERRIEFSVHSLLEQTEILRVDALTFLEPIREITNEDRKAQIIHEILIRHSAAFDALPNDVKSVFADYFTDQLRHCLATREDRSKSRLSFLAALCEVLKYVHNDETAELLLDAMTLGEKQVDLHAVTAMLSMEGEIPQNVIDALAYDTVYALDLYRALFHHGKAERFPKELITSEYFAESDLVHWLTYPTELGKAPDEIEYIGSTKVKKETFYVFRYRSDSENLSEDRRNQWLIGWSGDQGGTFSHFDLYAPCEQKTPEKTVKYIKKKFL